jgi:DNA-binding MurR/RpiR family transcriptional regulator
MARTIDYLVGPGQDALQRASAMVQSAPHVFVTGIGASWHAAVSAGSLLSLAGHPVYMQEAAELLHFTEIPRGSVVVAISRTGRSIEIIQLLAKAETSGAKVIGITNSADSPLALGSAVAIAIPAKLDHAISVNTYSTLLIAAAALASSATTGFSTVAPSCRTQYTKPGSAWSRGKSEFTNPVGSRIARPIISWLAAEVWVPAWKAGCCGKKA